MSSLPDKYYGAEEKEDKLAKKRGVKPTKVEKKKSRTLKIITRSKKRK